MPAEVLTRYALLEFYDLIQPLDRPRRTFNCGFSYLEQWLKTESESVPHGIDLVPNFQRGHVWSESQQIKFMENVLRRVCDDSALTIRFNCPSWNESPKEDSDLLDQMVCLDGLQRLTTIRKFIAGELVVFGLSYDQLPQRVLLRELTLIIKMYEFQYQEDLYSFYLDINGGGTPHTQEELSRVQQLRMEARRNK